MNDISEQAPKSRDAILRERLSRMLRSTLRRWPQAKVLHLLGGFGVSLDDVTYIRLGYSGRLTAEDMRDLLALFAVWLAADPDNLLSGGPSLRGYSARVSGDSN